MKVLVFALFVAVCLESVQAAPSTAIPTHLWPSNLPLVHPFKIICHDDLSVSILQNTSYNLDLFVAGNVSTKCPSHKQHFTIENQNVALDSSCMDTEEDAFLIEVQDRPVSSASPTKSYVVGGQSSIVYRVTCIPDTNGDPVKVTIVPPVSVQATASQLVLPSLKIGIFDASTVPGKEPKTPKSSLILGSAVQLVIYNDRSNNRMSYMLIPSKCVAYPNLQKQKPMLTLLEDDNKNTCTFESKMLSKFNVTSHTSDYDLAYATLYPFKFEGFPDTPVVMECTVYICPKDDVIDGVRTGYCTRTKLNTGNSRCSKVSATDYTKKRRRRDVGVGDSGVGRATLTATFSVQEPLVAGASRCSTGIWALVALMYVFK